MVTFSLSSFGGEGSWWIGNGGFLTEIKNGEFIQETDLVTDPKTGKKVKGKSRKWWGRFKDETGKEKRLPLAADKPAAQAMLGELVKKVERRLAEIEDPFETHQKKQLSEHSDDFLAYLANKESSWVISGRPNSVCEQSSKAASFCGSETSLQAASRSFLAN